MTSASFAIAAADHGSSYQAARAPDIKQATLSRNIPNLERPIRTLIFERPCAGLTMTLAGKSYLRAVRPR
ncbi:helix-turn-helix domain-containing protein [Teichococcus vastitatis]|uniref:helix-turn-helix domain-containing protein n=1 Tax=Teichococcus vastitatis TaxID=2307076 RepID=UPI0013005CFB